MQQQQHQPDLHAHPAAGFERDVASQVHSGTGAPRGQAAAGEDEEEVEMDESGDEQEGGDAGGENETGSSGKPARGVKRKKTARQRNPQAGQVGAPRRGLRSGLRGFACGVQAQPGAGCCLGRRVLRERTVAAIGALGPEGLALYQRVPSELAALEEKVWCAEL